MKTLLLAEHDGTTLSEATARALTAARALGGDVDILVCGDAGEAALAAAASLAPIIHASGSSLPEAVAAVLLHLAPGYDAFVAPASSQGKSVMPRLAAKLDVMQVSEVIAVDGPRTFRRPVYAGNAIQTVEATDGKLVLTIRTTAFHPAPAGSAATRSGVDAPATNIGSRLVTPATTASDRPDLGSARIVVSGGRGLGSKEAFDRLVVPLADKLGAAIGASRAAVDAGYAPNDLQVGQTGKVVAPELYIAIGISGAIQHVAGMKDSTTIVAINTDGDAPIFGIADYGLVGDLFDLVPQLQAKL